MAERLRASVVIVSIRPVAVRRVLDALRHQLYEPFEVIVVEGPPIEDDVALEALPVDVRRERCAEANMAKARNIGLAVASGETVAFIDDDAIPEAAWLAELLAGYTERDVAGTGGVVLDRGGWWPEWGYTMCDRLGHVRFDAQPPFTGALCAGADPFVFLAGGNMSFRRRWLADVGGFDETFALQQDDVDVCLRLIDAGARLRPLPNAVVHHQSLASVDRRADGLPPDPLASMLAFAYFATRHGATVPEAELEAAIDAHGAGLSSRANAALHRGDITADERAFFAERLELGRTTGRERGSTPAPVRAMAADASSFRRFGVAERAVRHLRVCVLSDGASAARGEEHSSTAVSVRALASLGHEVHVISPAARRHVGFDRSIWSHDVAIADRRLPELTAVPIAMQLYAAAAVYHEVSYLHERAPVDLVLAPLGDGGGLLCALDPRLSTATQLSGQSGQLVGGESSLDALARLKRAVLDATSPDMLIRARPDAGDVFAVAQATDPAPARLSEGTPESYYAAGSADKATRRLARVLSRVLADVCRLHITDTKRVAAALLDRSAYPVDYCAEALAAWEQDDASFVSAMYRLILDREADQENLEEQLSELAKGRTRWQVLEYLLSAYEAPVRRVPAGLPGSILVALRRDLPQRVAAAWTLPDAEFAAALNLAVRERVAEPGWVAEVVQRLRGGQSRQSVALALIEAPESRMRGIRTDWLARGTFVTAPAEMARGAAR
jgi:GT2 family glycosyltransferase